MRQLLAVFTTLVLTLSATTAVASASAEKPDTMATCGVGGDWAGYGEIGPWTLHGGSAYLYSGRTTAKTYARAYIANSGGSWIYLQRSQGRLTGKKWFSTQEVLNSGGYEIVCSIKYDFTGWVATQTVDGYQHGVRVCVRWAGSTNCPSTWYADQDR
jgi:hypothetical protein